MAGKRIYAPGEVIIEEKSHGTTAYIIERGRVEVSAQSRRGKVILGRLGKDEIFGEIGLLEDTPRTATVAAVDEVVAIELDRDDFNEALLKNPRLILPLMKAFFERLRQLNRRVVEASARESRPQAAFPQGAELQPEAPFGEESPFAAEAPVPGKVILSGVSKPAQDALEGHEMVIDRFPFKVGRQSRDSSVDALSHNDLYLSDHAPYNVSRNHFSINQSLGQRYLVDRGSKLGTLLNNQRLGGGGGADRVKLNQGENIIVVGSPSSPFRFRLMLH
ncbi:MAG: cyclic nucleotide-binding domain-containing protein [Candidatus Tectomicrobia bacterium]|nr:cyclic nucleotide-binding domain-containing protein [Candidatus Tectomicrobia bacterium]